MSNTWLPPQIGYIPTGNTTAGVLVSTVVIGRSSGSFEAAGFGLQGRPDYAQIVQINLTNRAANGALTQKGSISLNVSDIITAALNRPHFPTSLNLTLKEILVCEGGSPKGMIIIGSQTYTTGT